MSKALGARPFSHRDECAAHVLGHAVGLCLRADASLPAVKHRTASTTSFNTFGGGESRPDQRVAAAAASQGFVASGAGADDAREHHAALVAYWRRSGTNAAPVYPRVVSNSRGENSRENGTSPRRTLSACAGTPRAPRAF